MEIVDMIVDFKTYCESCKYKDKKDYEDPCNECLDYGTNENSRKPVKYEVKK